MHPNQPPYQPQGHDPAPYPPGQYGSGQNPYPQQQYAPLPYGQQQPVKPPKRRRVWPWILLAVVLIPVLVIAGCSALFVGGVSAVQDQRQGGTVAIGQTFTYKDGVAVTVADIKPYQPTNPYVIDATESAYQGTLTLVNGTKTPLGAALTTTNVTVGSTQAGRIFDGVDVPTADLAPGQTLKLPFQFKVKKGTKGALQISVTAELNEPVFFTGTLG
jgi:hypothetical protein